jgi:hypothetical protein
MTRTQVKKILDRVLTWPPERQADIAEIARLMEAQDTSALQLSQSQTAEVERRLADEKAEFLTLADFRLRLHQRYGV